MVTSYVHPEVRRGAEGQGRHRHREVPAVRGRRRAVQVQAGARPDEPGAARTSWPSTASGSASSPRPATSSRSPTSSAPAVDDVGRLEADPQGPVQGSASFEGKRYGVPAGTDGRVLFFNKKLFEQAGLPADWQPKSWDEIIAAAPGAQEARTGVTPIQINAGTAMGEATTMQGVLPLLVGTGATIYTDGKWLGDTPQLTARARTSTTRSTARRPRRPAAAAGGQGPGQVVRRVRREQDRHPARERLLLAQRGRADRGRRPDGRPRHRRRLRADPGRRPAAGVDGQDFVSMSGGARLRAQPEHRSTPQQAWELLPFMNSAEAIKAALERRPPRSRQRTTSTTRCWPATRC